MDAGSLRDVLGMVKKTKTSGPFVEEPYLANIAYQVIKILILSFLTPF